MTHSPSQVHCHELASLNAEAGRQYKVVTRVRPDDVALQGRFRLVRLRSGLSLHSTDATDLHDLVTQVVSDPGLTVSLFLQGRADISLGGRRFAIGRSGGPHGFLLNCAEPDLFERRGIRGNRVRKVNVGVPLEWFADGPLGAVDEAARRMARTHASSAQWAPSPRQLELAERLVRGEAGASLLEDLYLESHALELVADSLRLLGGAGEPGEARLTARERARLRAACDCLDALDEDKPRLDDLARQAGMSASALQRLFRAAFGMSVFEYARDRRMERAREMLERDRISVTEAAYLTGFSSPANFATAFKRKFGISPRQARRKE